MRPEPRIVGFAVTCAVIATSVLRVSSGASAEQTTYRFAPSGIDGGGFQNVVALASTSDATGIRPMLLGGDTSGYHRSIDGGVRWQGANLGIVTQADKHIASIAFSEDPSTPRKAYALFGNGSSGGLMVTLDGGVTWNSRTTAVWGDGGNTPAGSGLPNQHPRSTGNLIAQDEAGPSSYLWVATFQDGVKRSTDDGATWPVSALRGNYLRSLVNDPSDPNTLYAAAWGQGVWVSHDAESGLTFTRLASSPLYPEELLVLGQRLYVAAGSNGVRSYDPVDGTWSTLGVGQLPSASTWASVAGYRNPDTGSVSLYVGCTKPQPSGGRYQSIFKSTDGGSNWTPVTVSGVSYTVEGTTDPWWLAAANPQAMLDGSTFVASQLLVDALNPDNVFVAGRAGVWHSRDGGAHWNPDVRGIGAAIDIDVLSDPNLPGRVYVTDADRPFLVSSDGLDHVTLNVPKNASVTANNASGMALDTSTTPSTVYIGGDGGVNGELWSNADPATNPQWQREGLSSATGGAHVGGVAIGHDGGTKIVLAAASGAGIWRREGTGPWTKVSPPGLTAKGERAPFSWIPGSNFVYVYDRSSGVWRSADAGRSWIRLWAQASSADQTGYLAADPTNPARLFVSVSDTVVKGLYRFDDAGGTTDPPTAMPGFANPGALVEDARGVLYVHQPPVSASEPAYLASSNDGGSTWNAAADDVYRASAQIVNALAVDTGARLYVALQGSGVTVGEPPAPPPPPPPDTTDPTVAFTTPADGDTVGGTVTVEVAAADDVAVTALGLSVDDVLLGTESSPPYRLIWDTRTVDNGPHFLQATASDAAGNVGSGSVTVTVFNDTSPPTAPTALTATAAGPDEVDVSWAAAVDDVGVTGYTVRRGGSAIGTTTETAFIDLTVTAGQSYTYTVTAVDAAGNVGPASSPATVSTPNAPDVTAPSAPTNLTGKALAGRITLTWKASTDNVGVAGYVVSRGSTPIATVITAGYTDATVNPRTRYTYYVTAFDAAGNVSPRSNVLTIRSK